MIIETKRATFNPIKYPLAEVKGDSTKAGVVIDFDAKNQMVETNNVLEVYVAKTAIPGKVDVGAVAKKVTLVVTAAPTETGNITVGGVTIALDKTTETTPALAAAVIAAGNYASAGWTATQGDGDDTDKVFFTATAAGVKEDLAFEDTGTTGATVTINTTTEGADAGQGDGSPTLQIEILTGDADDDLAVIQKSEVFGVDALVEGAVLYKAALPDGCGQFVRVDLKNAVSGNDFADGLVVGTVRPL